MYKFLIAILLLSFTCLLSPAFAFDGEDKISNRELIETLVQLKEGMKALNKRFDDSNNRFNDVNNRLNDINSRFNDIDKRFDDINKRFDDVNKRFDDVNKRIDDLQEENRDTRTFMLWGFGILFGGMGLLITIVIWDRRTALAPVVKKHKELEDREERVEKALKEYARFEPKLAEVLKSYSLL